MPVLIRVKNWKAILRRGEWVCADGRTEALLNSVTELWIHETGGPAISDGDPEKTVAEYVAAQTQGRVLLHIPARPRSSRQLYLDRRQLKLQF
ncbi:MAG: hypothetical protein HUU41_03335 [Bryobacteraceae bacterium]|nr:hypothetical protein [Bryobacterales bacterium]MEB2361674.1 hypothetical protein [Bryobacterales bacterium]NUN00124.1 hypothetical protein [Bryobacteraceae bacterium]